MISSEFLVNLYSKFTSILLAGAKFSDTFSDMGRVYQAIKADVNSRCVEGLNTLIVLYVVVKTRRSYVRQGWKS